MSVEKVNRDLEAPQVLQDLQGLALVTVQHSWTWRAQGSQTWTNSGVCVVLLVLRGLQALLGLQSLWEPTVQ